MNETTNQSIATTGATTGGNVAAQKAMQDNWLKTPIRAVSEFAGRLKQVEQLGFLCNPFTPTAIPESYSLSEQIVMIHPEESEREVYKGFFCKGDYVALTKIGVLKIFRALGASVVFSSRTDDRRDPHYCAWSVMVRIRDVTGRWIDYPGSKEIDLRYKGADWQNVRKQAVDDQGEFEEGKFKRLVNQARQNIQSNAETKALLRAVRGIGGIRPAYKKEDLATKPFYCYRLQFEPDMSDQRVKEIVTAAEFGVVGQLWGGARDSSGGSAGPGLARSSAPREIRQVDWQVEGDDGGAGDFQEIGEPPVNQASANQSETGTIELEVDGAHSAVAGPPTEPDFEQGFSDEDEVQFVDTSTMQLLDVGGEGKTPAVICECACGDHSEVTEKLADAIQEKFGSVRCARCVPGTHYDEARHKELEAGGKMMGLATGDVAFRVARELSRKKRAELIRKKGAVVAGARE